ncbi:pantoate--beta-alanine ligase [Lewinella sp. W8]|uniref:pantoate--beta-alanine ligase n=1 Tax=Lewinella sp. W8 TaxID=2528208 RepID=UPI001067B980|nr:pantoate--beta-alanine ligase [Lewinella sp. W8]MTB52614.1 pantoate--beta-alanine ligase [Lewinella sp. W8]
MIICTTAAELNERLAGARKEGQRIGFVPTMGALHRGHMALIRASVTSCELTVASIFVNPTQFNEASDLSAYPRTPRADEELLIAHGCDFLYRPDVADIYPNGDQESAAAELDFGSLTERMEGAHRPGHFAGVAQVVSRLLDIVKPRVLFLGQKDYQQVAVIRSMVRQLDLPVMIEVVETVREVDGLALSSRNRRLGPQERKAAGLINRQLSAVAAGLLAGWDPEKLETAAMDAMQRHPLLNPEYVEVFTGHNLLPYRGGPAAAEIVVACAVHCGPVRLIDNRIAIPSNP